MKERRLAFLLGEEQAKLDNSKHLSTQATSQKNLSRCLSTSGVNKRIQNRIKTESKERTTSLSTTKPYVTESSSLISMYDSAELVASALGKSRYQNHQSYNIKSKSSFCLRRQSSGVGSDLNNSYGGETPNVSKSKGVSDKNQDNDRYKNRNYDFLNCSKFFLFAIEF